MFVHNGLLYLKIFTVSPGLAHSGPAGHYRCPKFFKCCTQGQSLTMSTCLSCHPEHCQRGVLYLCLTIKILSNIIKAILSVVSKLVKEICLSCIQSLIPTIKAIKEEEKAMNDNN